MSAFGSVVDFPWGNPLAFALLGYGTYRAGRALRPRWAFAPLAGRAVAALCWGGAVVAVLTLLGVSTSVTVPVLLAVVAMDVGVLLIAVVSGQLRPAVLPAEHVLSAESVFPGLPVSGKRPSPSAPCR